jgi:bifunctional non-homologous end joining protein LigD
VQLRAGSFTIDGEAVVCGPDGVVTFDALHRHGTVSETMLYAFDLLELTVRTSATCRWAAVRSAWRGWSEKGGSASSSASIPTRMAPRSSLQACRMGLEGIVSKRLSAPYRSGPSRDWIKVKNPDSPAMPGSRRAMVIVFDMADDKNPLAVSYGAPREEAHDNRCRGSRGSNGNR